MYVPPSIYPYFGHKRNNVSILTTAKNTTYTDHKPFHGYAFESIHMYSPSNQLTQALL